MKYTVAITDDHLLIAKALSGIVESFTDFEVLYEAANGQVLVEKLKNPQAIPDIVLLDISMPVMDGYETALWLKTNHEQVLVLALSMQDDEQALIKMIKSGARGYLHKNAHPAELEKALKTLIKNGFYYPDWATGKILSNIAGQQGNLSIIPVITDREKEFLQHAITELTYKEIAEQMHCSTRTVEGYRNTLFEKLDLHTRTGLVVYAIKNEIVKI